MTEGGCTVSGSVTVTGTLPGQANAGQDGAIGVCGGNQSVIDLFSLISGEQTGGYWTQISGTGGSFNAARRYIYSGSRPHQQRISLHHTRQYGLQLPRYQ